MTREQQIIVNCVNEDYQETATSEVHLDCPFCGEHDKKLYVSPKGQFICFKCESRGNSPISFFMQYYDVSYKEASDMLKDEDFAIPKVEPVDNETLLSRLVALNTKVEKQKQAGKKCPAFPTNTKLLRDNLNNPESYPYLWYLKNRGITLQQIYKYNLGYLTSGTIKTQDKDMTISNSIIFPTYGLNNDVIYWSTRSIEPNPFIKSFNALAKDNEYSRKDVVFNLNHVKDKMVICEGIFNAISSTVADYVGVATLGKAITDDQINLMLKVNPKYFYVFLDNDAMKEEIKLIDRLKQRISLDRIYLVVNPYKDKDANDLGSTIVKELLDKAQPVNLQSLLYLVRGEKRK